MAAQKWKINLLAEFTLHILHTLLANDFKTCYTVNLANSPKKLPDFGTLETNQRHEINIKIVLGT